MKKTYKAHLSNKNFWFTAFVYAGSQDEAIRLAEDDPIALCATDEEILDYLDTRGEDYECTEEELRNFKYQVDSIDEIFQSDDLWLHKDGTVEQNMNKYFFETLKTNTVLMADTGTNQ